MCCSGKLVCWQCSVFRDYKLIEGPDFSPRLSYFSPSPCTLEARLIKVHVRRTKQTGHSMDKLNTNYDLELRSYTLEC